MKKLILGACGVLMLAGVSCSKGNDAADEKLPRELCDSISMYSGRTLGAYVLSDYINFMKHADTQMSKDDIMKGIQIAFANADNEAVLAGIQIGGQLVGQLKHYEQDGIDIDRNKVVKNFRNVFLADTMDMSALAADNGRMNELLEQVQAIKDERERAAREDEAQASVARDDEYIASLKASDPDIQTSPSGLSYKIINPGQEPRVQDNSAIDVYYVGRLTDGTVFDQTQDTPATFSPSGVIPGFAEGLKMLGKGGKAVLYIPGELAYGANGVPQAGIGPNATLVFEVEVADVRNPQ